MQTAPNRELFFNESYVGLRSDGRFPLRAARHDDRFCSSKLIRRKPEPKGAPCPWTETGWGCPGHKMPMVERLRPPVAPSYQRHALRRSNRPDPRRCQKQLALPLEQRGLRWLYVKGRALGPRARQPLIPAHEPDARAPGDELAICSLLHRPPSP